MSVRYALYAVPDAAWGDFGAAWLGWDNRTGADADHLLIPGLDLPAITARPRKYGFHATLKAPFRLDTSASLQDLRTSTKALCDDLPPVPLLSLQLSRLGRFFALTAPDEQTALMALAARAVSDLDHLRAPLSPSELARRRKSRLTPAQDALLEKWGYPFVMDAYRFHITLTGPVADPDTVEPKIDAALRSILQTPLTLDALSLMAEDDQGRFTQIDRFVLRGARDTA